MCLLYSTSRQTFTIFVPYFRNDQQNAIHHVLLHLICHPYSARASSARVCTSITVLLLNPLLALARTPPTLLMLPWLAFLTMRFLNLSLHFLLPIKTWDHSLLCTFFSSPCSRLHVFFLACEEIYLENMKMINAKLWDLFYISSASPLNLSIQCSLFPHFLLSSEPYEDYITLERNL